MLTKIFIIAEAGVNHNGSLTLAKSLVDVACAAQADAVKFQTFCTEHVVCQSAPKADYQQRVTSSHESQFSMLKSLELSHADQVILKNYCREKNILFLSSPFDSISVDFLVNTLQLSCIKIASGEITHLPLLLKIARTGRSVILSTGMSTLAEVEIALGVLAFGYQTIDEIPSIAKCQTAYCSAEGQRFLQEKVSLLHCTTEYPAPDDEIHLRALHTLRDAFGLTVGYSDHSLGIAVSIAAVSLGARIIEKHFTLDKTLPGPDHQASLDPEELKAMVMAIRQVERALGSQQKKPTPSELKNKVIARKSVVTLQTIRKGEYLNEHNVGCKRPGQGISAIHFWDLQGTPALRDYEPDELIELSGALV